MESQYPHYAPVPGGDDKVANMCEELVPILHICEKSNQSLAGGTNTYQFLTVKNENYVKVRPPKLSKLTIRKFHIFQK